MAMEEEIRENAGDRMQDNISNQEGTKKWGNLETNPDGTSADPAADIEGGGQEFPRASAEEVHESAERAQAKFGGTYGGGGGVESDADEAIAEGEKPGPGSDTSASAEGGTSASQQEAPSAEDVADQAEAGDEMTTGQKFASILGSDPNMQAESKIAETLSGGDEENTKDI